jgi:hypothetical protein
MSEHALKQILKQIDNLQTDIEIIQSCPPASQTMRASIEYILNTPEPFIMTKKSSNIVFFTFVH